MLIKNNESKKTEVPVSSDEEIDRPAFGQIRKMGYNWDQVDSWVLDTIGILEVLSNIKNDQDHNLTLLRNSAKQFEDTGHYGNKVPEFLIDSMPSVSEPSFEANVKNGYNPHEVNAWAMKAVKKNIDINKQIEWGQRESEMLRGQIGPSQAVASPPPPPGFESQAVASPPPPPPPWATSSDISINDGHPNNAPEPPISPQEASVGNSENTVPQTPLDALGEAESQMLEDVIGLKNYWETNDDGIFVNTALSVIQPLPVSDVTSISVVGNKLDEVDEETSSMESEIVYANEEAKQIIEAAKIRANQIIREVAERASQIREEKEAQIERDLQTAKNELLEAQKTALAHRELIEESSKNFNAWREWVADELERVSKEFGAIPDPFSGNPNELLSVERELETPILDNEEFSKEPQGEYEDFEKITNPDSAKFVNLSEELQGEE